MRSVKVTLKSTNIIFNAMSTIAEGVNYVNKNERDEGQI